MRLNCEKVLREINKEWRGGGRKDQVQGIASMLMLKYKKVNNKVNKIGMTLDNEALKCEKIWVRDWQSIKGGRGGERSVSRNP